MKGLQPPVPRRVPQGLGRHLLPRLPLLLLRHRRRIDHALRHVRHRRKPVDLPDLWSCGVRQV